MELAIHTHTRPPDPVEVAAYYVVSEALTNTTKHAHASHAHIAVEQHPTHLHLSIHDDGIGGADPAHGSGLTGLRDRVHALDGTINVDSPPDTGPRSSSSSPCNPTDRSTRRCGEFRGRGGDQAVVAGVRRIVDGPSPSPPRRGVC